ncbi:MAG: hypothetical protein Q9213_001325 [Squamulea squamosa]
MTTHAKEFTDRVTRHYLLWLRYKRVELDSLDFVEVFRADRCRRIASVGKPVCCFLKAWVKSARQILGTWGGFQRPHLRQKLSLGAFLTMNVWLIVIALVRVLCLKQGDIYDGIWTNFWELLEAHVAILASSFTAFRSAFAKNRSSARQKENRRVYWFKQKLLKSYPPEHRPLDDLPSIPRATLTGLRTHIWDGNRANDLRARDRVSVWSMQGNGATPIVNVKADWPLISKQV